VVADFAPTACVVQGSLLLPSALSIVIAQSERDEFSLLQLAGVSAIYVTATATVAVEFSF
jgi:hypothetical protein